MRAAGSAMALGSSVGDGAIDFPRGYIKEMMERLRRLLQAVDDFQQRHRWVAFPMAVAKKYGEDQAGQQAARWPTTGSSRCSRTAE